VDDGEAYQAFCLQCFDTVSWAPGRAMLFWCVVICLERGADCLHMVQPMCVFVCPLSYLRNYTFDLRQFFCAYYL